MREALGVEFKRAYKSRWYKFSILFGSILAMLAFFSTDGWNLCKYWMRYISGDESAVSMASKMGFMDMPLEIWMPRYGAHSKFYYLWIVILPLLCTVPYAITYFVDRQDGLINQLITRMGRRNYYIAKLLVCFVNGGTIAVVPLIVNLVACMCFLPWGMPLRSTNVYPVGESNAFSEIFYTKPFLYVLIYLVLTFILFGLITASTMLLSLLVENRYALITAPFILYFAEHVFLSFGLGNKEASLLSNANLYNVFSWNVKLYFLELFGLLIFDLLILYKIRRDVL